MSHNSLRIIGGKWRGRKLTFTPTPGLRPTPDRVRETVFNWLRHELSGAHCLDLFSGSGALAWEALSQGAEQVTLIDNHPSVIKSLKLQQQVLDAQSQSSIIYSDALKFLLQNKTPTYHIIFIDAPFRQNLIDGCLKLIEQQQLLKKDGCLYIEMEKEQTLALPDCFEKVKHKVAGQLQYMLLILKPFHEKKRGQS